MIDWTTTLATARTTKATNEATAKAKVEAKKAEVLANQVAYKSACVVFDGVIAEQLSGVKILLNSYGSFVYDTSTTGVFKITYTTTLNGHPNINYYTLSVKYGDSIDVSTNTVTRLQSFISRIIVNDLGL